MPVMQLPFTLQCVLDIIKYKYKNHIKMQYEENWIEIFVINLLKNNLNVEPTKSNFQVFVNHQWFIKI